MKDNENNENSIEPEDIAEHPALEISEETEASDVSENLEQSAAPAVELDPIPKLDDPTESWDASSLHGFGEEFVKNDTDSIDLEGANPLAKRSIFHPGRAVFTLIALGAVAATLTGANLLPLPEIALDETAATVLKPTDSVPLTVCPGSFLNYGVQTSSTDLDFEVLGQVSRVINSRSGQPILANLNSKYPGANPISLSPNSTATPEDMQISGAQSQVVDSNRIAGFVATNCAEAVSEGWLTGGSTATGRSALIYLINPSPVAAPLELTFYNAAGRVTQAPVVVPAESELVLPLASYVPGESSPVIHLVAKGAPVAAYLGQTVTRVLNSGGAELVALNQKAALTQTIPLLQVRSMELARSLLSIEGYDDMTPMLRIFNPNDTVAKVQVQMFEQSLGTNHGDQVTDQGRYASFSIQLEPGKVRDMNMDNLEDGSYTIDFVSDLPVVASARSSSVAEIALPQADPNAAPRVVYEADLDWVNPGDLISGTSVISIAPGAGSFIELVSRSTVPTEITLTGAVQQSVSLAPGQSVTVPVAAGTVQASGLSDTLIAVGYSGVAQLASYNIAKVAVVGGAIPVYYR